MDTYNLISLTDISEQVRPCYVDEDVAAACIQEAQNIDLRSQLGDALFAAIFAEGATSPRIDALLEPREFTGCGCNAYRLHFGLRKVLCYYTYARIVRTGTNMQTRYGMVAKTDEYSEHTPLRERIAAADDAKATADGYMADVIDYIKANAAVYPEYNNRGRMHNMGARFRMIGN